MFSASMKRRIEGSLNKEDLATEVMDADPGTLLYHNIKTFECFSAISHPNVDVKTIKNRYDFISTYLVFNGISGDDLSRALNVNVEKGIIGHLWIFIDGKSQIAKILNNCISRAYPIGDYMTKKMVIDDANAMTNYLIEKIQNYYKQKKENIEYIDSL